MAGFAHGNSINSGGAGTSGCELGPEGVRTPLREMRLDQFGGQGAPQFQHPVLRFPMLSPNEEGAGGEPGSRRGILNFLSRFSTGVRPLTTPSIAESFSGRLSGQPTALDPDGDGDVDQTGAGITTVKNYGVDSASMGPSTRQWGDGSDGIAEAIRNQSDIGSNVDSITDAIQSWDSEQHRALRSVRAAFTNLSISPLPQTRTLVILAPDAPFDLILPDNAVLVRWAWSGMFAGVDLFISTNGQAVSPKIANSSNQALYDGGGILNPDAGTWYYTKGKKAYSCMMLSSGPLTANPFLVNAQVYCQN
jgi:hypothetical protein